MLQKMLKVTLLQVFFWKIALVTSVVQLKDNIKDHLNDHINFPTFKSDSFKGIII